MNSEAQGPTEPDSGPLFGGDAAAPSGRCPDAATHVYLVTQSKELYVFDARALTARRIGPLDCPSASGSAYPLTMSVDRSPKGWALYTDGILYNFDLATARCTPTGYTYGNGLNDAGTSYRMKATYGIAVGPGDSPGAPERLYWETLNEPAFPATGLGWMDPQSFAVTRIGPVDDRLNGWPSDELKVLGDGRMFALAVATPANPKGLTFGELDPKTGAARSTIDMAQVLPSFNPLGPGSLNFAFAFWGGSFWFFAGTDGKTTDVYERVPSGKTTKVATLPIVVSGSGESTCAPLAPPK